MEYAIISEYLTYCTTIKRLSSHTLRAYKNDLTHYYKFQSDDVNLYLDHLYKTISKNSTLKRKIASLKVFYRYLFDQKIIESNPLQNKRFQYKSERTLPKIIPLSDLSKIFNYLENDAKSAQTEYSKSKRIRNWLIFSLLLSTGLRISELCSLKLEQLNMTERYLIIKGKGQKERLIYLGDDNTVILLNDYLKIYRDSKSSFLFPGKIIGKSLSEQSIRRNIKILSTKLELSKIVTPHMFRHSFATMLLDSNVDIRHIQHLLGHSSITITQIYTSVSQNKQKEILTMHNPFKAL